MKNVYKMITSNGAKTLKIEDSYGIEVGMPANLIILDAFDEIDALRRQAAAKVVISNGVIISKTQPSRTDICLDGQSEHITYQK